MRVYMHTYMYSVYIVENKLVHIGTRANLFINSAVNSEGEPVLEYSCRRNH